MFITFVLFNLQIKSVSLYYDDTTRIYRIVQAYLLGQLSRTVTRGEVCERTKLPPDLQSLGARVVAKTMLRMLRRILKRQCGRLRMKAEVGGVVST